MDASSIILDRRMTFGDSLKSWRISKFVQALAFQAKIIHGKELKWLGKCKLATKKYFIPQPQSRGLMSMWMHHLQALGERNS